MTVLSLPPASDMLKPRAPGNCKKKKRQENLDLPHYSFCFITLGSSTFPLKMAFMGDELSWLRMMGTIVLGETMPFSFSDLREKSLTIFSPEVTKLPLVQRDPYFFFKSSLVAILYVFCRPNDDCHPKFPYGNMGSK